MIDANVAAFRANIAGAAAVLDVHAAAHGPRVDVAPGRVDFDTAGDAGDLERTEGADEPHGAGDRADRDVRADRAAHFDAGGLGLHLEDGPMLALALAVLVAAHMAEDSAVVAMAAAAFLQFGDPVCRLDINVRP